MNTRLKDIVISLSLGTLLGLAVFFFKTGGEAQKYISRIDSLSHANASVDGKVKLHDSVINDHEVRVSVLESSLKDIKETVEDTNDDVKELLRSRLCG